MLGKWPLKIAKLFENKKNELEAEKKQWFRIRENG